MTGHHLAHCRFPLPQHSRDLALELRGLLEQLDPGRWRAEAVRSLHDRLVALRDGIARLLNGVDPSGTFSTLVDTRAADISP